MTTTLWFLAGLFIGLCLGVFIMCLVNAASLE
jgi:hypothetical protein